MERAFVKVIDGLAGHQVDSRLHSASFVDEREPGDRCLGIAQHAAAMTDLLGAVKLGSVRWPGAKRAAFHHWRHGVGPADERPTSRNPSFERADNNRVGSHEFIRFCEDIHADPQLVLNLAGGTVAEARDWLEYCNSSEDTVVAKLRRQHGRHAPWDIAAWQLGAACWGVGGGQRAQDYVALCRRLAGQLAGGGDAVSPALTICGGQPGLSDWSAEVLAGLRQEPSVMSAFSAIAESLYLGSRLDGDDLSDRSYFRLLAELDFLDQQLTRLCGLAAAYSTPKKPLAAVLSDWGLRFRGGRNYRSGLRDALFTTAALHACYRHGEHLKAAHMGIIADRCQSLLRLDDGVLVKTPTYHVFHMLSPHGGGDYLPPMVDCRPLKAKTSRLSLSVAATVREQTMFLSILNLHLTDQFKTDIRLGTDRRWRITETRRLSGIGIGDNNTASEPNKVAPVTISAAIQDNEFRMALPPKSLTTIAMTCQ